MEFGETPMSTKTQPLTGQGPAASLTNEEILRYSRHLIMPEVGMDGQLKLKAAKVLLIGTGGLARHWGFISPRRASGKSGWWILTWWTSPICNVKLRLAPAMLASPRPARPTRASAT